MRGSEGLDMTIGELTQVSEAEDYRQRMVANLAGGAFVSFLIISGYWIVSTLAG
jgi:hypothetical protein